jgi:hypothetical protein
MDEKLKIRKTQEEEVIEMLEREGFRELSEKQVQKEPYKSIYAIPECFKDNENPAICES